MRVVSFVSISKQGGRGARKGPGRPGNSGQQDGHRELSHVKPLRIFSRAFAISGPRQFLWIRRSEESTCGPWLVNRNIVYGSPRKATDTMKLAMEGRQRTISFRSIVMILAKYPMVRKGNESTMPATLSMQYYLEGLRAIVKVGRLNNEECSSSLVVDGPGWCLSKGCVGDSSRIDSFCSGPSG